ncbi:MAG: T9SS type A sorting domain-containing protein [Crocinitomicaceae bacterium]|nr:T9SS type A sorting domain-containing protein [Crocinitomicaceae bacterium]
MKILAGLTFALLLSATSFGQTNATEAAPIDCEGATHNLFSELEAGKIIVIGWTMPCASCAGPLLEAHNAVLSYAVSNPGVVEYWMTDDYANSACNTIQNWCTSNGITSAEYFASAELDMSDYGTAGMPKVVVLGCSDHKVYYNENNGSPSGAGVTAAIDAALADMAIGCAAGVEELYVTNMAVSCFPNPASSVLNVTVGMVAPQEVVMEVVGLNGKVYSSVSVEDLNLLTDGVQIDVNNLATGFYLLKVTSNDAIVVEKFEVK